MKLVLKQEMLEFEFWKHILELWWNMSEIEKISNS